jgi:hypothetical protein
MGKASIFAKLLGGPACRALRVRIIVGQRSIQPRPFGESKQGSEDDMASQKPAILRLMSLKFLSVVLLKAILNTFKMAIFES